MNSTSIIFNDSKTRTQLSIDVNTISGGTNSIGQYKINGNTISTNTVSNTLATAVFCDNNQGVYSPSVVCNQVASINAGFAFYGPNPHTVWAGNVMQPLNKGLVLFNGGVIGQQGSNTMASANQWAGAWTGSHTDVSNTSSSLSVLWTKNVNGYYPAVNTGSNTADNYVYPTSYTFSQGGDYSCVGLPNLITVPKPNTELFSDNNLFQLANTSFYRLLSLNDSVVTSNSIYSDLLAELDSTSVYYFLKVEELLGRGSLDSAISILAGLNSTEFSNIDANYFTFYGIYTNYLTSETGNLITADSSSLYELANLCPSSNGGSVYQARALYNLLYHNSVFSDNCENTGLRKSHYKGKINEETSFSDGSFDLIVYPNPAKTQITLIAPFPSGNLHLAIQDVTGRIIQTKEISVNNRHANIDLLLDPGIYLLAFTNKEGLTTTKKIIIEN